MAIPRFSSLLWEEAGRGLWVRCYDMKDPGKDCLCRQVWSQLPLDLAGQLLSQEGVKGTGCPPPHECLCDFWHHQEAEMSFFSVRESMCCFLVKLPRKAIRNNPGRPNGKCLVVLLALQSCNFTVIISLYAGSSFFLLSQSPAWL